ncbi:MAG: hypothetical protein DSZ03_05515 [Sulfurimonas sp.]|nr:MAG: hypothetical protein DSZ03_05515 [Sulfurimonas sp.]
MRFLALFLSLFLALQAEQQYKKIILGSYSHIENAKDDAQNMTRRLGKDPRFLQQQKQHNLKVTVEKNGNFFSVVLKPFAQRSDALTMLNVVRKYQKDAYLKSYVEKPSEVITPQPVHNRIAEEVRPMPLAVIDVEAKTRPVVPEEQQISSASEGGDMNISPQIQEAVALQEDILVSSDAAFDLTKVQADKIPPTFFEKYALMAWALVLMLAVVIVIILRHNAKLQRQNEQLVEERISSDIAIKTKDEFLAKMSHEIRTPMNAIVGFSHLLLDTKLDTDQLSNLSKIKSSADILLEIINDILDFSKLEAGMFKLEKIEFNVNTILENAANLVAVEAKKRHLEFVFDIDHNVPIKLIGDPLRVDTILINLLSNAVKFTKSGEVILKVSSIENADQFILDFEIKDTGIGIAPEKLSELFTSFSQADNSSTRVYGGTGLGLVITKELIELMGGEITVESEVGVGTTFKFQLLFDRPEHVDKRKYRLPSKEIMKKKVLIIDENSSAADSLTRMIAYYQYSADVVATMNEALYALKILPYDIVCIDSKIIAENVDNFIEVIREKTSAKIVLLNGGIANYQKIEGIDTELFKPFNQQDLFNAILDLYQPEAQRSVHTKGISKKDLKVLSGATILLAEDNKINQSVIQSLLSHSGVNLLIANNGQEAIDMLYSNEDIDLILMDISMPVLNGYDAASQIRLDDQFKELPILALTANALSSDVKKSQEVGMQEHMSKPLNVEQFYRALLKYISPHNNHGTASGETQEASLSETPHEHAATTIKKIHELITVNTAEGMERAGGDKTLYKEILREFEKQYYYSSRELEEYRSTSDFDKGEKLCHDIKGVAANIGAYELSESVKNLEYAFKSGSIKESDGAIIHYNRELEKVLIDIQSFIEYG